MSSFVLILLKKDAKIHDAKSVKKQFINLNFKNQRTAKTIIADQHVSKFGNCGIDRYHLSKHLIKILLGNVMYASELDFVAFLNALPKKPWKKMLFLEL